MKSNLPELGMFDMDRGASALVISNRVLIIDLERDQKLQWILQEDIQSRTRSRIVDLDISTEAQGVLYTPGMRKNLWFAGKFVDEGHFTLFGSRACWFLTKTKPHQIFCTRTQNTQKTEKLVQTQFITYGCHLPSSTSKLISVNVTKAAPFNYNITLASSNWALKFLVSLPPSKL